MPAFTVMAAVEEEELIIPTRVELSELSLKNEVNR
jgi:hypothetical protein